jgi:ATP-dependent exoDNAse (exonuclease V) beta subunit
MIPNWIYERLKLLADPRLRFNAELHEYHLDQRQLTSWSQWIKQYKAGFDAQAQAPRTAAKRGLTVEQVLAEWERSNWVGSKTHEFIEAYYQATGSDAQPSPHPDMEVQLRCRKFLAAHAGRLQDFLPVAQELRVFHEPSGLCGTLDFLGWHVPTQQLYVLDWKTNKAINSDRDTIWRMMWGPFKDLADHEHNTYSLQISLYRMLLEEAGLPTGGGAIVHLPPGRSPAQVYKAIDYRSRLRDVIF